LRDTTATHRGHGEDHVVSRRFDPGIISLSLDSRAWRRRCIRLSDDS
jgi:hypothetical protein